jgi:hypothetical protein
MKKKTLEILEIYILARLLENKKDRMMVKRIMKNITQQVMKEKGFISKQKLRDVIDIRFIKFFEITMARRTNSGNILLIAECKKLIEWFNKLKKELELG